MTFLMLLGYVAAVGGVCGLFSLLWGYFRKMGGGGGGGGCGGVGCSNVGKKFQNGQRYSYQLERLFYWEEKKENVEISSTLHLLDNVEEA